MTIRKRRIVRMVAVAGIAGMACAAAAAAQSGKPINVAAASHKWAPFAPGSPIEIAILWGDRSKGEYAMLLRMPPGFDSGRHAHTADYQAVTVQGTWVHTNDGQAPVDLGPGSHVMQPGKQMHNDACKGTAPCIIFVHQHAPGDFIAPPAK